MKRHTPLRTAIVLLLSLPFMASMVLAQPGPPWSGPGEPGPPPWVNPPEPPQPPTPPEPPANPAPPTNPGGGDDDDDDDGGHKGPPPFCSSEDAPTGPSGQAGVSSIAHVNFALVDQDTGEFLDDGAWARMMYRWYAPVFDYVFNAHELPVDAEYTLTYQPEPMPSPGVICLGTGTVNDEGDLHLQDAFDIATDLPAAYDENEEDATLALVPSADVDCDTGDMLAWVPEDYLFTTEGIIYVHSDLDDLDDDDDDDDDDDNDNDNGNGNGDD